MFKLFLKIHKDVVIKEVFIKTLEDVDYYVEKWKIKYEDSHKDLRSLLFIEYTTNFMNDELITEFEFLFEE